MSKKKILIVEDDKDIARLLQYNMDKAGYFCEIAVTGEMALVSLGRQPFDLIILDVMLPGVDGFEVCRRVKQDPQCRHIPVMLLTARGEEVDRIVGLEIGAEDYVVKPFSPREVVLRVKALLRRSSSEDSWGSNKLLEVGGVILDKERHSVTVDGKGIVLTAMEFKLLALLMERRGRVQDREKLLNDVWGVDAEVYTRTIDTHVRRLRSKLGSFGYLVETVSGVGYRFRQDADEG